MTEFAVLLQAIAALLWPAFAFTTLFVFRRQIVDISRRLKKGKFLGQELELENSLDQLRTSANQAEQEVAALPTQSQPQSAESTRKAEDAADVQRKIASESAKSPYGALLVLSGELEILARQVLATTGHLQDRTVVPLQKAIVELQHQFGLPPHLLEAMRVFWKVRNRLLHEGRGTEEDVLRALDSGLTLLKALQAIPREINVVVDPNIQLFSDDKLAQPMHTVHGVLLETTAPDGSAKSLRIFPTTREHFQKGRQVTWEWNPRVQWGAAWYRHPETGQATQGWLQSLEFTGRHLDEI